MPAISADGYILTEKGPVRGHAVRDNGHIEFSEGPFKGRADVFGVIVPALVDTHTHCADAGVRPVPGMTLEELVAPPDGLKHRYLRETPREKLVQDMSVFDRDAADSGIGRFVDFREGGADGCRMAREACPHAVILGRPVSPEFDAAEIDEILSVADGIALSSINDIDPAYADKVADATHRRGKAFAVHCSERIREDIEKVLSLEPAFVVHMCLATRSDLRACADFDIPISVCPRSNRFFGRRPPLETMRETGCTVALGSDNAMLCSPDLRPEALLASEIAGGRIDGWIWQCLSSGGQQLLYRACGINAKSTEWGFRVLPMPGKDPRSSWGCTDRVPSFRTGDGNELQKNPCPP